MNENQVLVERFEANRAHLQAVAYRMLGSLPETDDAVQEAWLRLNRSDVSGVDNLRGWLTTVVARVCLDMLRSRKSRREEPLPAHEPEPSATPAEAVRWSRAERGAGTTGLAPTDRGDAAVAQTFSVTAQAAQSALVNGAAGLVWATGGRPRAAMRFTIVRGKIVEINLIAAPDHVRRLDITIGQP